LVYDLVVVGGGMGGLATAALAGRLGLRTALLEAHGQ
jgi:phytoene dehydrogenase-like protein